MRDIENHMVVDEDAELEMLQPDKEPDDEIEERAMLIEKIKSLTNLITGLYRELGSSKEAYHLLASEMVYEGNSVQYWRDKAIAYKKVVDAQKEISLW
jgi:hypothetical protein